MHSKIPRRIAAIPGVTVTSCSPTVATSAQAVWIIVSLTRTGQMRRAPVRRSRRRQQSTGIRALGVRAAAEMVSQRWLAASRRVHVILMAGMVWRHHGRHFKI